MIASGRIGRINGKNKKLNKITYLRFSCVEVQKISPKFPENRSPQLSKKQLAD